LPPHISQKRSADGRRRRHRPLPWDFTTYIDSGFGLLGGEVAFLATTLAAVDITLAAIFWSWAADEDIIAGSLVRLSHLPSRFVASDFVLESDVCRASYQAGGWYGHNVKMAIADRFAAYVGELTKWSACGRADRCAIIARAVGDGGRRSVEPMRR